MASTTDSGRFLNELTLIKNDFNILHQYQDKTALAQVIQNILLIEPGTYPNNPTLGVGIENYLFEKVDSLFKTDLETIITNQIYKFIPNSYGIDVDVDQQEIEGGLKALVIKFEIRDYANEELLDFGIVYGTKNNSDKIVSKLII